MVSLLLANFPSSFLQQLRRPLVFFSCQTKWVSVRPCRPLPAWLSTPPPTRKRVRTSPLQRVFKVLPLTTRSHRDHSHHRSTGSPLPVEGRDHRQDGKPFLGVLPSRTLLTLAPIVLQEHNHWRILIHHGKDRAKTAKELSEYDVVLTTYHTLAGEWPDMEAAAKKAKKDKKHNGDDGDDSDDFIEKKKGAHFLVRRSWWTRASLTMAAKTTAGPLFNLSWFRIVSHGLPFCFGRLRY